MTFLVCVDKLKIVDRIAESFAGVAELADALRSGRSEHYAHVGSNPTFGTQAAFQGSLCFLKLPEGY